MIPKFKKGDRVRVTYLYDSDVRDGIEVDHIGIIDEECIVPYVQFEGKQGRYAMDEDQLELAPEPEPEASPVPSLKASFHFSREKLENILRDLVEAKFSIKTNGIRIACVQDHTVVLEGEITPA